MLMSVIPGASAKYLHLRFQKYHIPLPKTKLQQPKNQTENDMIYCAGKKMLYIDIEYKSAPN